MLGSFETTKRIFFSVQITLSFNGPTLRHRFERINLNGKLHQLVRLNVNAAVFGMAKGGHHDINFYLA